METMARNTEESGLDKQKKQEERQRRELFYLSIFLNLLKSPVKLRLCFYIIQNH